MQQFINYGSPSISQKQNYNPTTSIQGSTAQPFLLSPTEALKVKIQIPTSHQQQQHLIPKTARNENNPASSRYLLPAFNTHESASNINQFQPPILNRRHEPKFVTQAQMQHARPSSQQKLNAQTQRNQNQVVAPQSIQTPSQSARTNTIGNVNQVRANLIGNSTGVSQVPMNFPDAQLVTNDQQNNQDLSPQNVAIRHLPYFNNMQHPHENQNVSSSQLQQYPNLSITTITKHSSRNLQSLISHFGAGVFSGAETERLINQNQQPMPSLNLNGNPMISRLSPPQKAKLRSNQQNSNLHIKQDASDITDVLTPTANPPSASATPTNAGLRQNEAQLSPPQLISSQSQSTIPSTQAPTLITLTQLQGIPKHSEQRKKKREENLSKIRKDTEQNPNYGSSSNRRQSILLNPASLKIGSNAAYEDPNLRKLRQKMDKEREQLAKMQEASKKQKEKLLIQNQNNLKLPESLLPGNQNHHASSSAKSTAFISPRIATSSSLLSKGFSVKSNNFLNFNAGQITQQLQGKAVASSASGALTARAIINNRYQGGAQSPLGSVEPGQNILGPGPGGGGAAQTQSNERDSISTLSNNNNNASAKTLTEEQLQAKKQLEAKIMSFQSKIEKKINNIKQQIQEGRVDINVNQLETAISEVMSGATAELAVHEDGDLQTPRMGGISSLRRIPSLKSKRSNQEEELEEEKDFIYKTQGETQNNLSPSTFISNSTMPFHRRLQTAKGLTIQTSTFKKNSNQRIVNSQQSSRHVKNQQKLSFEEDSDKKNLDKLIENHSPESSHSEKRRTLEEGAGEESQSPSHQARLKIQRKKQKEEQRKLLRLKEQERKDRINEFVTDMFPIDFHLLKSVARYKEVKNKQRLNRVSNVVLEKDKEKRRKKTRPVLLESVEGISNQLFPKHLILRNDRSHQSASKSTGATQMFQSGALNQLSQHYIDQIHKHASTGLMNHAAVSRPFSAIKNQIFDPVKFFHAKNISSKYPSFKRDFSIQIWEQIYPSQQLNQAISLHRIDIIRLKSTSPHYPKQSMLKEFKSNNFGRLGTTDSNMFKEAVSITTNPDIKTISRDQEIDDFLFNDQERPPNLELSHVQSSHRQGDATPNEDQSKSFNTPRLQQRKMLILGVDDNQLMGPLRISTMNQTFRAAFSQQASSIKKNAMKQRSNQNLLQQRNSKLTKQLVILTKEELKKCEDAFLEEYFQKKQIQKQYFRQVTGSINPSSTMVLDPSSSHNLLPTHPSSQLQLQLQISGSSFHQQPQLKRTTPQTQLNLQNLAKTLTLEQQIANSLINKNIYTGLNLNLEDRMLDHLWNQQNNKQYFILSSADVLDKLESNLLDEDKIADLLVIFNLDIKYQIYESASLEKKEEDNEVNNLLGQLDQMFEDEHFSQTNFLDLNLVHYVIQQQKDGKEDSTLLPDMEKNEEYFEENILPKRKRLSKTVQRYVHEHFFQRRFEDTASYFSQRRMIEYPTKAWANDRRICTNVDSYKNKEQDIHSHSWTLQTILHGNAGSLTGTFQSNSLKVSSTTSQAEMIRMIFQPHHHKTIFYLLFDADEDYELQLTMDRIYHHGVRMKEIYISKMKKKGVTIKPLYSSKTKLLVNKFLQRKVVYREKEKRHKSLGYSDMHTLQAKNFIQQDSLKSDTSFRSSAFSKVNISDNNSLSGSEMDNRQSKLSSDYVDFLPLMRKNALRKNYGFRKQHNINKEDEHFIRHRVYKSRITWQKHYYSTRSLSNQPRSSSNRLLHGEGINEEDVIPAAKKREYFSNDQQRSASTNNIGNSKQQTAPKLSFQMQNNNPILLENYDVGGLSSNTDSDSDSNDSSISAIEGNAYFRFMPKRISNISKQSEQISVFTPIKNDLLGNIIISNNTTIHNQQPMLTGKSHNEGASAGQANNNRDFMIKINVGALESRKELPPPPRTTKRMIKRIEKRYSKLLRKAGSMDGILIDRFAYQSLLRMDEAHRFLFEVFEPVEIKFTSPESDLESAVNRRLEQENNDGFIHIENQAGESDHLTTDSSLRGQDIDKYAEIDYKIQKQQLKKFFQQQKLRQKQKTMNKLALQKVGSQVKPESATAAHIHNQNTLASSSGHANVKASKSSLANLHHQNYYATIGTYYKNLKKQQKYEKNTNQGGEVVSGEEFVEDDENNFYQQMRNNLKIMELLNEVGGGIKRKGHHQNSSKNVERKNSSVRPPTKPRKKEKTVEKDQAAKATKNNHQRSASIDQTSSQQRKTSLKTPHHYKLNILAPEGEVPDDRSEIEKSSTIQRLQEIKAMRRASKRPRGDLTTKNKDTPKMFEHRNSKELLDERLEMVVSEKQHEESQSEDEEDSDTSESLFSNSDDRDDDIDDDHKLSRGGRRHSIKSFQSKHQPTAVQSTIKQESLTNMRTPLRPTALQSARPIQSNLIMGTKLIGPIPFAKISMNNTPRRLSNQSIQSNGKDRGASNYVGKSFKINIHPDINIQAGPLTLDRPLASMRENSEMEGLFEPPLRINLQKVNSNISFFKRQKLLAAQKKRAASILKNAKVSTHFDYNKRTLYMRDQLHMEKQIIQAVVHQDQQNFKQLLHKFDLSLDTFRDPFGNTLLSIATQLGNKYFVEMLLGQGADPNIPNMMGNVPLHYAITNGFTKITDLLMEFGANEWVLNNEGKSPWEKCD